MSIVTMKNKTRATRNVKIQNKTNNMGYGNYLKNKIRGSTSCTSGQIFVKNVVKSRVNKRINYDQYIISKKMCCIRKILQENCKNNITKKKASSKSCSIKKTQQPNYGKYQSNLGGRKPTLKQRILNSCGCTKDLSSFGATKYGGSGFAASASKRLERIIGTGIYEDNKSKNNNARNASCGVY